MARVEKGTDKKGKRNKTQSALQPAFNLASSLNRNSLKSKQSKTKGRFSGSCCHMMFLGNGGDPEERKVHAGGRGEKCPLIWVFPTALLYLGALVGANKPGVVWLSWAPGLWRYSRARKGHQHQLQHLQQGRGGGTITLPHLSLLWGLRHSLTMAGLRKHKNKKLSGFLKNIHMTSVGLLAQ